MIILKTQAFGDYDNLAKFVNLNNIKREDILAVTSAGPSGGTHFIFYYADSEAQEITHGVFGWSK